MTPIALAIAGSDPSGGAGVQADLKTFAALGVYGASVLTALTAQNTRGVRGVHDVPPEFVAAQLDAVLDDLAVRATKIGMLSVPATIAAVAGVLARRSVGPVVLDPVMVATSGDRLLAPEAVASLVAELLPAADLLTPNLPEAAALLGEIPAEGVEAMAAQAARLRALGPRAVLLKGGHGAGERSPDVLVDAAGTLVLDGPRLAVRSTHGTGCTLSSAIAAGLARGLPLREAARAAKAYLTAALAGADALEIGRGRGPVDHFHAHRREPMGTGANAA